MWVLGNALDSRMDGKVEDAWKEVIVAGKGVTGD